MDYRNADGSIAEMCGNGVRVFARYLLDTGLAAGPEFAVATRAGLRQVSEEPDGQLTVDMGGAQVTGSGQVRLGGAQLDGLAISVGNPHLACVTDTPVADFDLTRAAAAGAGGAGRRGERGGRAHRRRSMRPRCGCTSAVPA